MSTPHTHTTGSPRMGGGGTVVAAGASTARLNGDRVLWGQGSGPGSTEGIYLSGKQNQLMLDPAAVDKSPGSGSGAEQISVFWLGMDKGSLRLQQR